MTHQNRGFRRPRALGGAGVARAPRVLGGVGRLRARLRAPRALRARRDALAAELARDGRGARRALGQAAGALGLQPAGARVLAPPVLRGAARGPAGRRGRRRGPAGGHRAEYLSHDLAELRWEGHDGEARKEKHVDLEAVDRVRACAGGGDDRDGDRERLSFDTWPAKAATKRDLARGAAALARAAAHRDAEKFAFELVADGGDCLLHVEAPSAVAKGTWLRALAVALDRVRRDKAAAPGARHPRR